ELYLLPRSDQANRCTFQRLVQKGFAIYISVHVTRSNKSIPAVFPSVTSKSSHDKWSRKAEEDIDFITGHSSLRTPTKIAGLACEEAAAVHRCRLGLGKLVAECGELGVIFNDAGDAAVAGEGLGVWEA